MKKTILLLASNMLFIVTALQSQVCAWPNAQIDIHANNVKARLLNGGDMFWDFTESQFYPNYTPGETNATSIYAAGLWIGGLDSANNLKLACIRYRSSSISEYWAGPLNPDGTTFANNCANWDRFFKVYGSNVADFRAQLPDIANNPALAANLYPEIMGWPAKGNPWFQDVYGFALTNQDLAPFFDNDGNGIYDPLSGDFPVVELENGQWFVPAEFVWWVYNDEGGGQVHGATLGEIIHIEVQQTAWGFNCPDQPVLNNTLFTQHRLVYKGFENLDSVFTALWVDFDLGCSRDDYVGCNPALNTFFVYNQDAVDGDMGVNCSAGGITFADSSPVQSATFLNRSLDKFSVHTSVSLASNEPDNVSDYYQGMTGSWPDGTQLTYGGTGYDPNNPNAIVTDFHFPDSPDNPDGWSMCTSNLPPKDHRTVSSVKIGQLIPSQVEYLVTAWTTHPNPNLPCGLGSTFSDVATVQTHYDNAFADVCSPLTSTYNPLMEYVHLFPNPTTGSLTIQYGVQTPSLIRLYSSAGTLAYQEMQPAPNQTQLNLEHLAAGLYTLELLGDHGRVVRKVILFR